MEFWLRMWTLSQIAYISSAGLTYKWCNIAQHPGSHIIIWEAKMMMCCAGHSGMSDSATPSAVACRAPLSMGILQARILQWVFHALLQGIFPTQELNLGLLHCRQILYQLSYQGSPEDDNNRSPSHSIFKRIKLYTCVNMLLYDCVIVMCVIMNVFMYKYLHMYMWLWTVYSCVCEGVRMVMCTCMYIFIYMHMWFECVSMCKVLWVLDT